MIFLRVLVAGASFLFCVLLGAVGGFVLWWVLPTSGLYSSPIWTYAGAAVGAFVGALVGHSVWSLLGERTRRGCD
jgi:hypothetical protein